MYQRRLLSTTSEVTTKIVDNTKLLYPKTKSSPLTNFISSANPSTSIPSYEIKQSTIKPIAREAKKQIQELLIPERSVGAAKALAHLGVGSASSLSMELLTSPDMAIGKIIRLLSKHGKNATVERILFKVLNDLTDTLRDKRKEDSSIDFNEWHIKRQDTTIIDHLERQLRLLAPYIEMKSLRKHGRTYNVPVAIATEARRKSLILRWLVENIRGNTQQTLEKKLYHEFSGLRNYRSPLFKKVLTAYSDAYANRAYAHFRF